MICLAIQLGKNAPKTGGGAKGNGQPSKDSGTSGANGGATGADISAYAKQIQVAIQSRLAMRACIRANNVSCILARRRMAH